MEILTVQNIAAHALQVALLALLATAAAALVRVDSAPVRHSYWRATLALAVMLPWLRPLEMSTRDGASASVTTTIGAAGVADALPTVMPASRVDWFAIAALLLAAGAVVRIAWIAAGCISLRRLRGLGTRAIGDIEIDRLQEQLGTLADVRYVTDLTQPATFGVWRPVVLLPASVRDAPAEIRRALVCHELFHVKRRDWMWVLGEELLLAAFWFNPAMWWIVAQIRRTREEAVDELTVLATGSRRTYVKALLAFAEDAPLAPAPAFAHRRHLFRRITLISREAVMSSKRIVLSCAAMALVLLTGSWYAASAFPITPAPDAQALQAEPGPLERRARPVTRENPVPSRTNYQAPDYPAEARAAAATGTVTLRVTIDELGRVGEMRRTGFSFASSNPAVSVSLPNASADAIDGFMKSVLRGVDGTTADPRLVMRIVDAFTAAAAHAVGNWRYEPPADGPLSFDVTVRFKPDGETSAVQNRGVQASASFVPSSIDATGAVRVGGTVRAPVKVRHVNPVYPAEAQAAKVRGMVIIEARIGRDGAVEQARVLRSIPLLDAAALDAVQQWQFTPTLLNGVPTPVIMTVTVNFTLQ